MFGSGVDGGWRGWYLVGLSPETAAGWWRGKEFGKTSLDQTLEVE
jgi:hypothetical protein